MAMKLMPGPYRGKIKSTAIAETKTSGNQQIVFIIDVTHEISDDDGVTTIPMPRPETRTVYRTITENTVGRCVKELRLMNYHGSSFSSLDKSACDPDDFVDLAGTDVPLFCTENNYNGQQNERWEFDFPGLSGGAAPKSSEQSKIQLLDSQFGSAFASEPTSQQPARKQADQKPPASAPANKPPASRNKQQQPSNETIPF